MKKYKLLTCESCGKKFKPYFENEKNNLCPRCWLNSFKVENKEMKGGKKNV
jgi:DNA-directed RNA polymerase subunit RPC12/RpoP